MTFRDAQGATFDLSAVTVVAWQSKTGDSIHLGVAGSPPRCAGRDPTPVAETRKFAVHREDERPAVTEALNLLNVAVGLSELASRVESKRLCRRCSARYITRPTPTPENDPGLSAFQREMPSVAESALQEALDDPPF
jgi:hypothetical protein